MQHRKHDVEREAGDGRARAAVDRHDLFRARMGDQVRFASVTPDTPGGVGAALLDDVSRGGG